VLALTAGAPGADVVRMGTEGAYPPYNFINDAARSTGSSANWATSCASAPR
jgi:polar amino acid transport system substrate-binding protein